MQPQASALHKWPRTHVRSGVVHMVGGGAALVGAALLGPRLGRFSQVKLQPPVLSTLASAIAASTHTGQNLLVPTGAAFVHQGIALTTHLLLRLQDGHAVQFSNASAAHMALGVFILWLGWCALHDVVQRRRWAALGGLCVPT